MNKLIFLLLLSSAIFAQQPKDYTVTNYGAVNDGKTLTTTAFQKAIDAVSKNGGGRLLVPAGNYLIGTIELKSNVEIHLQKNAVLLGSTTPGDYRSLEMKGRPKSPKQDDNSQLALIVAFKVKNSSISGEGTIDGQGLALALHIDSLHHAGIAVDPKYDTRTNRPNETMRPKLVRFSMCENVTFSNVTFRNSACWGLSFELCKKLTLEGLTIFNRAYWNNDGMDITDCTNVRITNCDINSADDGICLKSYYPGFANDSVYIANCTIRSGASAVKFGTASYGDFRNIVIENINIFDTFRSAIALESVDGGTIENIKISNVIAKNTGNAIFIRLGHRGGDKPGIIRNVLIKDITVGVPFGRPDIEYDLRAREPDSHHNPFPSSIVGIPGHSVQNVVLENVDITYPGRATKGQAYLPLHRLNDIPENVKDYPEFSMFPELPSWAFYVRHAENIHLKNVTLKLEKDDFRPAFVFDDVKGITLEKVNLPDNMKSNQVILKNADGLKMIPEAKGQVKIMR